MFKPLLRTLPTLSGNFTLACKLDKFNQTSSKEYEVYIKDASLVPLQNNVFNKDIKVNLLKDQYEYVVKKYYRAYSDIFYKDNHSYNKNDYVDYDQYEINHINDSRNKDYEFGMKRIQYSQNGYQFCFYAPFYIDNIDDLPDYFYLVIKLNDTLEKKIKVMINKDYQLNYLKVLLDKYVSQIDNNVIFCLPESKQATYFGIDVENGGLVKYIDNVFGNLYNSQNTINNFDYTICSGFERHNLIMKQIIPLSFEFNLNDFLNYHEKEFFKFCTISASGFYYKDNYKISFYDFSIDYSELYAKYLKYDDTSGTYNLDFGYDRNSNKINVMNVSYPSLNEAKYTGYRFTNKITPNYCRFKLMHSLDSNPYIINMSYAFSYLQNPNNIYGEFPTMFKDIFPISIVKNSNMILPIGSNKSLYYLDDLNIEKYIKLMTNFYASWYTIFNEGDDIFENSKYWSDVNNGYSYFRGILYKLDEKNVGRDDFDKFGIFLNVEMNCISNTSVLDEIVMGRYVLSNTKYNNSVQICEFDKDINENQYAKFQVSAKLLNYNESYIEYIDEDASLSYSLTFDINGKKKTTSTKNAISKNSKIETEYKVKPYSLEYNSKLYKVNSKTVANLLYNEKMKKDRYGTFILDKDYYYKNIYYDFDEVKNILKNVLNAKIYTSDFEEDLDLFKIKGYELLDIYNPLNLYEKMNSGDDVHYRIILDNEDIQKCYNPITHPWYLTTAFDQEKISISNIYDNLSSSINYYSDFRIFKGRNFIAQSDLFELLNKKLIAYTAWPLNLICDEKYGLQYILKDEIEKYRNNEIIYNELLKFYNKLIAKTGIKSIYNKYIEFQNAPLLPLIISNVIDLQKYNYNPYDNVNVKISNYFYKDVSNNDKSIYVDTYNLNKYIVLYNSINYENQIEYLNSNENEAYELNKYIRKFNVNRKNDKINEIIPNNNDHYERKEFYSNILNKSHIEQYINKLIKNENIFDETLGIKNYRLLDELYIKERIWYIDSANSLSIKDRYISLYKYIKNIYNSLTKNEKKSGAYDNLIMLLTLYEGTYVEDFGRFEDPNLKSIVRSEIIFRKKEEYKASHDSYTDEELNAYITSNESNIAREVSETMLNIYNGLKENTGNNGLPNYSYENKYLMMLISSNKNVNGLFDFKLGKNSNSNNESNASIYSYNQIELDLVFKKTFIKLNDDLTNVLKNDRCYLYLYRRTDSKESIFNWPVHKYSSDNEYDIKEIDDFLIPLYSNPIMNTTDVDLIKSMIDNNKISNNKIISNNDNFFKEINVDYYVASKSSANDFNKFLNKFNIYEIDNKDNRLELTTEIYNKILEIKSMEDNEGILKEYYETYIPSLGITLYSIYDINHTNFVSYEKYCTKDEDFEYDESTKLNIVHKANHTYGFYMLNIILDNTNNSFNINNSFDISTSFMKINNKDITNEYVKSVFHIIQPFIKFNIFKDFASKIKNVIVIPSENDILINYESRRINPDDEYKYTMLKDSADDIIYDSIGKYAEEKKLKLIRYFGYISPLLTSKSILSNIWENKFIYKRNNINVKKYNVLYKKDLNIYEYDPIYIVDKYDALNNKEVSHHFERQYEYKHFNDNFAYNLEEEIIIRLKDVLEYDDMVNNYETEEYTLKLFENYINNILNTKLNINIILFLYNKYDISYMSVPYKLNSTKSKRLYKISYKFTLK